MIECKCGKKFGKDYEAELHVYSEHDSDNYTEFLTPDVPQGDKIVR